MPSKSASPNKLAKNLTAGFTLVELLLAVIIGAVIIIISYLTYTMATRFSESENTKTELAQNARVTLDRLIREIRQAEEIITNIPATTDDPLLPPTGEIMFQDGHELEPLRYITYYVDTDLKLHREISHYYFDLDPDTWVRWNAEDNLGNPANEVIDEDNLIAEYIDDLKFWGEDKVVNIQFTTVKDDFKIELKTAVCGRNLR